MIPALKNQTADRRRLTTAAFSSAILPPAAWTSAPGPGGILRLRSARPNPQADPGARLYLLTGDATAGPITAIVPDPGLRLPGPQDASARPRRLTLLHFNDLHHHLATLTPTGAQAVFGRLASHIHDVRRRCAADPTEATLTVSAGDDLIGTVFDELLMAEPAVHAAYRVYSAAGVDAAAIGNHDLDLGPTRLLAGAARDAAFPLLSANLILPDAAGQVCAGAIFVLRGLRVGLIGLTTPAQLHPTTGERVTIADPVQTARNLLPALQPLCDVTIILSHLGYSLDSDSALVSAAGDVELAQALPKGLVHLIIGGHTHHVLHAQGLDPAHIVNDIPILQAGCRGEWLGEVTLEIEKDRVAVATAGLIPTISLPPDAAYETRHIAPLAARAGAILRQPLGRLAAHPDLADERVRKHFAADESALANFIADALLARCRAAGHAADFAAVDASSVPTGLPPGPTLTFGDWFNVMPYADTLWLIELSATQLIELLDDNARRADRPGEPHVERGFLHFSREVRYTVLPGLTRQAARAAGITVAGETLRAGNAPRPFVLACSSFVRQLCVPWERRAAAEGVHLFDLRALPARETGLLLRHEMVAYIKQHDGVTAEGGLRRDGRVSWLAHDSNA